MFLFLFRKQHADTSSAFKTPVDAKVTKDLTTMLLVVRVPVLSVQMTDVQPRVSTDGRLRTMTLLLAIRAVPGELTFVERLLFVVCCKRRAGMG